MSLRGVARAICGWGLAFFGPQLAAELQTVTGRADLPFYLSAAVLAAAVIVSRFVRRPTIR